MLRNQLRRSFPSREEWLCNAHPYVRFDIDPNVHLAHVDHELAKELYTVCCEDGIVLSVQRRAEWIEEEHGEDGRPVEVLNGNGGLLIPSLCHSHIHLDKCYILEKGAPLVTGDFEEALRVTADVKNSTFVSAPEDLYARGNRLIRESVACGVTAMRAHVEVDASVNSTCVDVGLRLSEKWKGVCDVQLALFMQDPLFDGPEDTTPGANAAALDTVLERYLHFPSSPSFSTKTALQSSPIQAIGSAPYVGRTRAQQLYNMQYILERAHKYALHADFHLDYDLKPCNTTGTTPEDSDTEPLIFPLLDSLRSPTADLPPLKSLTLGHLTRLTVFPPAYVARLQGLLSSITKDAVSQCISLVALPQSDLYMMGRCYHHPPISSQPFTKEDGDNGEEREKREIERDDWDTHFGNPAVPRGTLDVLLTRRFADSINNKMKKLDEKTLRDSETTGNGMSSLVSEVSSTTSQRPFINVALSVNNVGNAFTPQGAPDPFALCPLGVAVYQDARVDACHVLLESISTASKLAIGHDHRDPLQACMVPCKTSFAEKPTNAGDSDADHLRKLSLLPCVPPYPGLAEPVADFVLLHDNTTVQAAALDPSYARTTIKQGRVVARRRVACEVAVGMEPILAVVV